MVIKELKKAMMKAKKTNKIKSDVFMMILDTAQKIAKPQNRSVTENDITKAATKLMKHAHQSNDAGIDVDLEMVILAEFLPVMLTDKEIEVAVDELKAIRDNSGFVMKELKAAYGDTIDMKKAIYRFCNS